MKKAHSVKFKIVNKALFGLIDWVPVTVEKTHLSRSEARLLVRTLLMNGYNLNGRVIPTDQILEISMIHQIL